MFEEVKLYGTLINKIKYQNRNIDFSYQMYISYDPNFKKYYLMALGHG